MAGGFNTVTYHPRGINPRTVVKIAAVVIVLLLLLWLTPFGTIAAGERGVHLRFRAVQGIKQEGLYFIVPLMDTVQRMDIKIQKEQVQTDAASKDLQTVNIVVALNYHVNAEKVADIYQRVGLDY
jgi:regulator of protease activity HflC (stomatin/prohibitin superfamily)